MVYRRTENVVRHLAAREQAILNAATAIAGEGGMGAVQIAAVAARADVAAGTVYRYFPSKNDLVGELVAAVADRELTALRTAADSAPGPLSALAAAIATFAARAVSAQRLIRAVSGEAAEPQADAVRLDFRKLLAAEIERLIRTGVDAGHLPEQDCAISASAIVGMILEGLVGPLAPHREEASRQRTAAQMATLLALRALGVVDARARGLVVQCPLPATH